MTEDPEPRRYFADRLQEDEPKAPDGHESDHEWRRFQREEKWRERSEAMRDAVTIGGIYILGGTWFIALLVVAYEGFLWLQHAEWPRLGTEWILRNGSPEFTRWLENPQSWLGAHKLALWFLVLPLSMMIGIVGAITGGITLFLGLTSGES
jgi:hypothetical protein